MFTHADKRKKQTISNGRPYGRRPTEEQTGGFPEHRSNTVYQRRENHTGLSDQLKGGIEALSGVDMSDVRVHRNSAKPAAVNALAYTQGTQIHVAPGQDKHIAHEAWHAVQQKQGRVPATGKIGGMRLNDSKSLESEADVMGKRAIQTNRANHGSLASGGGNNAAQPTVQGKFGDVVQARLDTEIEAIIGSTPPTANRMEGFSAQTGGGTRLTTDVTWDSTKRVGGYTDGDGMTATMLGPDHPKGSGPSGPARQATDWANSSGLGISFIAGHLLNDNLGGTGKDARNLTVIPSEVNKNHSSKVEEPVKEAVNEYGNWVFYESKVINRDHNGLATELDFNWYYLDDYGNRTMPTENCNLTWKNTYPVKVNVSGGFTKPGMAKPGAARSGIALGTESIPLTNKEEDYYGGKSSMVKRFPAKAHQIGNEFAFQNDTDRIIVLLIRRYNSLVRSGFATKTGSESAQKGRRTEQKYNWIIDEIFRFIRLGNTDLSGRFPSRTPAIETSIKREIDRFSRIA